MRILILDNFDSFVYNLYQYFGELGAEPQVFRNNAITVHEVEKLDPDAIVISPGPGNPTRREDFGVCKEVLLEVSPQVPTLGVCLGHQGIGAVFGASIGRAKRIVHGKPSSIYHDGKTLFTGIPNPFVAGRYHSLVVVRETIPGCLEVSAHSEDEEVMGLRHRSFPIEGVQFHPESILTADGKAILRNFLAMVKR